MTYDLIQMLVIGFDFVLGGVITRRKIVGSSGNDIAVVDGRRGGGFQALADGVSRLVIVLRELGDEGHACRYAQEIRIEVVPPFVRGATASRDGRIDSQGGAADQGAYPADAGKEARHGVLPAMLQERPEIFDCLHATSSCVCHRP